MAKVQARLTGRGRDRPKDGDRQMVSLLLARTRKGSTPSSGPAPRHWKPDCAVADAILNILSRQDRAPAVEAVTPPSSCSCATSRPADCARYDRLLVERCAMEARRGAA